MLIQNETKNGRGVKIDTFNNPPAAPVLTDKWSIEFDQPERLPTPVSDAVAPWLRGHLVLNDHPYAVASRSDGSFELRNLPVGTWNFKLWHERSGYLEAMTIDGQTKTARFGQLTLTIEPGDNDLGDIVLPPAEFER